MGGRQGSPQIAAVPFTVKHRKIQMLGKKPKIPARPGDLRAIFAHPDLRAVDADRMLYFLW